MQKVCGAHGSACTARCLYTWRIQSKVHCQHAAWHYSFDSNHGCTHPQPAQMLHPPNPTCYAAAFINRCLCTSADAQRCWDARSSPCPLHNRTWTPSPARSETKSSRSRVKRRRRARRSRTFAALAACRTPKPSCSGKCQRGALLLLLLPRMVHWHCAGLRRSPTA